MATLADMCIPTRSQLLRGNGLDDWVSSGETWVLLVASVVLLETAILGRTAKQPSSAALFGSLIANGLSTLVGACLVIAGVVVRGEGSVPQFVAMFICTLLVEMPVLLLLLSPRTPVLRTLLASAGMNLASYSFIGLLLCAGMLR